VPAVLPPVLPPEPPPPAPAALPPWPPKPAAVVQVLFTQVLPLAQGWLQPPQ
jgi:hypothetical protein